MKKRINNNPQILGGNEHFVNKGPLCNEKIIKP